MKCIIYKLSIHSIYQDKIIHSNSIAQLPTTANIFPISPNLQPHICCCFCLCLGLCTYKIPCILADTNTEISYIIIHIINIEAIGVI